LNLRDVLEEAAAGLAAVELTAGSDGALTWSRAGRPFAVLTGDGDAAEFGLDGAVATAALRTPDVAPSQKGRDWVRFQPAALDQHGADRAAAWFGSAYRRVGRD
jgi:hypothetical protein